MVSRRELLALTALAPLEAMGQRRPFPPSLLRIAHPGSGGAYNYQNTLNSKPSFLSSLATPTDPTTTSTHNVTNNSELTTALGGNGRRINILSTATITGGITVSGRTDLHIYVEVGASVEGDVSLDNAQRIKFEFQSRAVARIAGEIRINASNGNNEDIQFINWVQEADSTDSSGHAINGFSTFNVHRVLFLGCDISATGTSSNILSGGSNVAEITYTDIIVANSQFRLHGADPTEFNLRFGGRYQRVAIIDSHLQNGSNNSLRIHEETDGFWVYNTRLHATGGNNIFIHPEAGVENSYNQQDILFEENQFYDADGGVVNNAFPTTRITNLDFLNNDVFELGGDFSTFFLGGAGTGWSETGTTVSEYSAPAAWQYN